jgi:hypothetical protein
MTEQKTRNYAESFKLFKPRKTGDGVASQWEINVKKEAVFLTLARQRKDKDKHATFEWKEKPIVMKLDISDIGEILAVLYKRQNGLGPTSEKGHKGLFHQTERGNTVLRLEKSNQGNGFYLQINQKIKNEDVQTLKHHISDGEGLTLSVLLTEAIRKIMNW